MRKIMLFLLPLFCVGLLISCTTTSPENAKTYLSKGDVCYDKGNFDAAIKNYSKAIELNPDDSYVWRRRGYARSAKGDHDDAIMDYSKAIELGPKYAYVLCFRGYARCEKGDIEGAIKDYNKAIELNSKYSYAWACRGKARYKKGDFAGAIQDYNKAVELDPADSYARICRGDARFETGDFAGALKDFNKALDLAPKSSNVKNHLAWLLATCPNADLRNPSKAVEYAEKVCVESQWKDVAYLDTLAAAYAASGDFKKAIEIQAKIIGLTKNENDLTEYEERLKLYKNGKPYIDSRQ